MRGRGQTPVSLCFPQDTVERLVDGICRYEVDRGKYLKTPGLSGETCRGLPLYSKVRFKVRKGQYQNEMFLRKHFVFCRTLNSFCLVSQVILPHSSGQIRSLDIGVKVNGLSLPAGDELDSAGRLVVALSSEPLC